MAKKEARRLRLPKIISGTDVVVGGGIIAGRRIVPGDQVDGEAVPLAKEKLLDGRPLPEGAMVSGAYILEGIESPEGKFTMLLDEKNRPILTMSGKFVYVPVGK